MDFKHLESQSVSQTSFMYDTIYFQSPDVYSRGDEDDEWEDNETDEEDEDFDDTAADLDDLNSIRAGDDLDTSDDAYDITNPDPDDDHLPDDDLQ
ncbi:hypothetical protein ACFQZS_00460 [Mucilaginibacter calamicampi]|uniref:Uncharacterized protein n=1 Tax=Mucilaginibacter calamicampi TaxID=1302352 RepID=A0ABW2YVX6_9SPHI